MVIIVNQMRVICCGCHWGVCSCIGAVVSRSEQTVCVRLCDRFREGSLFDPRKSQSDIQT